MSKTKTTEKPLAIDIDFEKSCPQCGESGVVKNGLCLRCAAEKMVSGNGSSDQVRRLLQLLKDLDHLEAQKHDYLAEYRRDRDSLEQAIQKLRAEIESGQKELFTGRSS